jgi:hypothetical protein
MAVIFVVIIIQSAKTADWESVIKVASEPLFSFLAFQPFDNLIQKFIVIISAAVACNVAFICVAVIRALGARIPTVIN